MSDANATELVPRVRREGDAVVVAVSGEIDLHNSPDLKAVLIEQLESGAVKKLVVNLSDVPYVDSSAIAVFVEALQRLHKTGGKVYLTNLQPRVRGLLEIAKLHTIFVVTDSEQAALAGDGKTQ